MTAPEGKPDGERGPPTVRYGLSAHTRVSNLLALGLMLAMGAAVLTLYYVHAVRRQAQSHARTPTTASERAKTEVALPDLGVLLPPPATSSAPAAPAHAVSEIPLSASPPALSGASAAMPGGVASRPSGLERRLAGAAFTSATATVSSDTVSVGEQGRAAALIPNATTASPVTGSAPALADIAATAGTASDAAGYTLTPWLRPLPAAAASARVLPTQRLLLPKGAFIDCTLETAIDSTLPSMTTCVTATDTFGVDGRVVLLERGTKLIGETRGQVQQGAARVFVLWSEARTPTGVIVPLDSPAADALGRSGLPGNVDRHFWERFGAALLISTIDGGVQAAVQSSSRAGGTVIYSPSATQDVSTEVLKNTLSIPPTVRKQNGDRIQVLVARDIDFTRVYELHHAGNIE